MEIASKRINFDDGSWWEILEEMPFGVSRRMARVVSSYSKPVEAAFETNVTMLVFCTTKWSFSAEVSEEELEKLPRRLVRRVLDEMNELYKHRTSEEEEELKKD